PSWWTRCGEGTRAARMGAAESLDHAPPTASRLRGLMEGARAGRREAVGQSVSEWVRDDRHAVAVILSAANGLLAEGRADAGLLLVDAIQDATGARWDLDTTRGVALTMLGELDAASVALRTAARQAPR